MSRVLVTGAFGAIGRALINRLGALDLEVMSTDLIGSGQNHFAGDIRSKEFSEWVSLIRPKYVIHLAGSVNVLKSFQDPEFDLDVNVKGTLNLLKGLENSRECNIVYLNSGGAIYSYDSQSGASEISPCLPISPYGISKLMAENYIRVFFDSRGLGWTSLAVSNCYGNFELFKKGVLYEFYKSLQSGATATLFGHDTTRDFIFVEDVVDAILESMIHPTMCRINISSAAEVRLFDAFQIISQELNVSGKLEILPSRQGEIERSWLDNSLAFRLLKWRPRVEFREGVRLSCNL